MKKYLKVCFLFMFLVAGCSDGGSSKNSPTNDNPPPVVQKVTRCEAYELSAKCLNDSMRLFGTYVGYKAGQSIEVRQSEDLMTALADSGLIRTEFAKPIALPDFGDSVYEEIKFVAKKNGQIWFTFSTANARDLSSESLSVSYSNSVFGYAFDGKMMSVTCSNGNRYNIDNISTAYNECNSKTLFPFTNVPSFNYLSPNQCGVKIGLHGIDQEFWFLSIYKPRSAACN